MEEKLLKINELHVEKALICSRRHCTGKCHICLGCFTDET